MIPAQRHAVRRFTACAQARIPTKSRLNKAKKASQDTVAFVAQETEITQSEEAGNAENGSIENSQTANVLDPPKPSKYQSYRTRTAGNRALPLSPFLDPARFQQRWEFRNRLPKPPAPPESEKDEFRKRLDQDPYAALLAKPVRSCNLTTALLPTPFLVKLHTVQDPQNKSQELLVPIDLYDAVAASPAERARTKSLGSAVYLSHHRPYIGKRGGKLGARSVQNNRELADPKGLAPTIDELIRDWVVQKLRGPLRQGNDFVPLSRLEDAHDVDDLVAVLFVGAEVYSEELERKMEFVNEKLRLANRITSSTQAQIRSALRLDTILSTVNSRSLYPRQSPSELPPRRGKSSEIKDEERSGIPVLPLVDILGAKRVKDILEGTMHQDTGWVAVKRSRNTSEILSRTLQCYWWFTNHLS